MEWGRGAEIAKLRGVSWRLGASKLSSRENEWDEDEN